AERFNVLLSTLKETETNSACSWSSWCWRYGASAMAVFPCRVGSTHQAALPPVCVAGSDLPCAPQHVKTLKVHSRVKCLFKGNVAFVPTQRCVVTKTALRRGIDAFPPVRNSPQRNQPLRAPPSTGTPQPLELPKEWAGPSHGVPLVSFEVPLDYRMLITALEGEPDLSGEDDPAALLPSGQSEILDADLGMMAMLARATKRIGLEWKPPPCPEPSRLDDWYFGVAHAGSQGPTPVPFFSEVYDKLTEMCTATFTARKHSSGLSSLTTLDGGAARVYTEVPLVERLVVTRMCPSTASTWRGKPLLPSRAHRHSSALIGSGYVTCGEAASTLHEGGSENSGLPRTLRYVRQRETDKTRFLNSPVSQTCFFGNAVENFAQQISAAQKQTEALLPPTALQERVNVPLLPPEEGQVEKILGRGVLDGRIPDRTLPSR
ncbi:hypothetical protein M9458_029556, partial [Cirrhinus mrigala]